MNIIISNSSGKPIYEQIVAQIKQLIMTDVLKEGDAYEVLEKEGFIETITGKGSFVAGKDKELIREERYRQIEALLEKACETARMNGMTLEELLDIMTLLYKEE